jgi:hypothetical protein
MQDNEEVLVSCHRFERVHLDLWRVKEWLSRGGSRGSGGDRGKLRNEGSVWWGSLFAFVFYGLLVLEEGDTQEGSDEEKNSERRGEAARQDGGRILVVEAMPCRSWSRLPNAVERERRELANEGGG